MTSRKENAEAMAAFLDINPEVIVGHVGTCPSLSVFPVGTVIEDVRGFNNQWIREEGGYVEIFASYDPDWRAIDTIDRDINQYVIVSVPVHWINEYLANYQEWGKKEE